MFRGSRQLALGIPRASANSDPHTWAAVRVGVASQQRQTAELLELVQGRSSLVERAGLPQLSTHTFRHLCLIDLARAGSELHEIASFAGHRKTSTILIYIHLSGR